MAVPFSSAEYRALVRLQSPGMHLATLRCSPTKSPIFVGTTTDIAPGGTPFAGELARVGENRSAPIACLFFLKQASENKIEPIAKAEAIRRLMRNILFFAEDSELVQKVFQSACDFVERVPSRQLSFLPDSRAWSMIQ
jgi:hypothetical protein